ncbi:MULTISPECIES: hypothetical protein [Enterobacter]|jgi:hypothetical protein|uniref:hypothetical protein n=1 Tax=Enterobacter TaxID=547 RepID=UPI0028E483EC|nr:hypothetical protein [Enterobacter cloacae]WNT37814.1 hypothetical protein RRL13_06810 [Enterobacter cloacae]HDR2795467.1 hypothetical protein [Enterobacter asburiae]HDR2800848.1 hypothetical protein [Enterobacter asburiae]
MKKLSIFIIPAVLIFIFSYCYYHYRFQSISFPAFKICNGKTISDLNINNEEVKLTLTHKITMTSRKEGYDYIRGIVVIGDKLYKINRTLQFRVSSIGLLNNHQYEVKLVQVFPEDSLPQYLAEKYITFLKPGEVRDINIEKVGDGLLLIGDTTGPSFVCRYTM